MHDSQQRIPDTQNSGQMHTRRGCLHCRLGGCYSHTRVANQNTHPFLCSSTHSFYISPCVSIFFSPFLTPTTPFLPRSSNHHSREEKHAKGIATGAMLLCLSHTHTHSLSLPLSRSLSPLVIVVDFDRCPQKHCSICAPF